MNAEDVHKYGNLTVQRALENVPAGQWDTPNVCGWWSVREIMAHLASFERLLEDVLTTVLGGAPGPTMLRMSDPDVDFNEVEVASRNAHSRQQVMAEYNETHMRTAALIARVPLETRRQIGVLPWYGPEYDLEDYITYSNYGHKREHMSQVNVFLDTLKME